MQFIKRQLNRRGQSAVEYVITTVALFAVFLAFYAFYSNIVPKQFEQGARIILEPYYLDKK